MRRMREWLAVLLVIGATFAFFCYRVSATLPARRAVTGVTQIDRLGLPTESYEIREIGNGWHRFKIEGGREFLRRQRWDGDEDVLIELMPEKEN